MEFVNIITLIARVIDFADALKRKFTEGRTYRRSRFGSVLGELYYWLGILNTEDVQRYHFNINFWTKDEALAWRDAYISKCSAISVAAAIFASIGQSALSFNGLTDAHWSASALLSTSMVFGILSVCAAVTLQNTVAGLSNHKEIRLWLSRGVSDWTGDPEVYQKLPLESSAPTVKLSDAPQLMLSLSIFCYFVGFGLYLLYGWAWAVVEPASHLRNNFIFYVCVIAAILAYISFLWAGKIMDKDKVNQQFNLKRRFDTGEVDTKMEMLDTWSDVIETLTSTRSEAEKAEARQELEEILWVMRYGVRRSSTDGQHGKTETRQESADTVIKESDAA